LTEWDAYERLYGPLGPARGDYHAALIATTTANTVSKKPMAVSDFMPDWADRGEVLYGDDP
jgi:hypothetical protein